MRSSVTRRETEALSPGGLKADGQKCIRLGMAKVLPSCLQCSVTPDPIADSRTVVSVRVGERTKTNTMARVNEKVVVGGVVCWACREEETERERERERHRIRAVRVT